MPDAIYAHPDRTTFARLDDLGLEAIGQRLDVALPVTGYARSSAFGRALRQHDIGGDVPGWFVL